MNTSKLNSNLKSRKYTKKVIELLRANEQLSTCAYRTVSAILVDTKSGRILAEGYNGTSSNVIECKEIDEFIHALVRASKIIKPNIFASKVLELHEKLIELQSKSRNPEYLITDPLTLLLTAIQRMLAMLADINNYEELSELSDWFMKIRSKYGSKNNTSRLNAYLLEQQLKFLAKTKLTLSEIPNDKKLLHGLQKSLNYAHYKFEQHAEKNLLYTLRASLDFIQSHYESLTLFVSATPCFECSKMLYQFLPNLKEIFYIEEYIDKKYGESSIGFWKALGVTIEPIFI